MSLPWPHYKHEKSFWFLKLLYMFSSRDWISFQAYGVSMLFDHFECKHISPKHIWEWVKHFLGEILNCLNFYMSHWPYTCHDILACLSSLLFLKNVLDLLHCCDLDSHGCFEFYVLLEGKQGLSMREFDRCILDRL